MKKCFITSIVVGSHFKNYDIPGKFPKLKDYDYFLFTNLSPEKFNTSWDIKQIKFDNDLKSITNSRFIKFQGWELLKDYDIIIHLDSYLRPIDNKQIWDKIVQQTIESKNGIIQSRHPIRDCPYEECIAVYKAHKDSKKILRMPQPCCWKIILFVIVDYGRIMDFAIIQKIIMLKYYLINCGIY